MSGSANGTPRPGDPPHARPPSSPLPGGDLPPMRRLLAFLYALAAVCGLLAAYVWWQLLR